MASAFFYYFDFYVKAGKLSLSRELLMILKDYLSERSVLQIQLLIFLEAGLTDKQPMRSIRPDGII